MKRRTLGVVAGTLVVALLASSPATAASAGALDTTFGNGDGAVIEDVYSGAEDYGSAMAIQPDGKIVVAGTWVMPGGYSNWSVMRFMPDGSVDKSFGSGGRTLTDFDNDHEWVTSLAIAPDGKIVVAGHAYIANPNNGKYVALARYESDGDPDPTFSNDGEAWFAKIGDFAEANDVAIQRDGKIVVVGMRYLNSDTKEDYVVARVTTSGNLDVTFSTDGLAFATFGEEREAAHGVAIQPADGKIVVAGYALDDGDYDFALARFDRYGDLDPDFDGNGTLLTGFGVSEFANDVAVAFDGKIVAGGTRAGNFVVSRYSTKGQLDTTFNTTGKRIIDLGGTEAVSGVAVQLDGKVVLAGSYRPRDSRVLSDMAVVRLTSLGAPDSSFSGDGVVIQGVGGADSVAEVAIQRADGKIVVAGSTGVEQGGNDADFALLRFYATAT